jgi:hypothetical protein
LIDRALPFFVHHDRVAAAGALPRRIPNDLRCISQCEPAHIGAPPSGLIHGWGAWISTMENRFDFVTISNAVCLAGYVALTLWYVTLFDLGFSREAVRGGAMLAAILIAVLVAVDFFGKYLRKAK